MYYYMNKDYGYLLTENELWQDAEKCEYDDITDPYSCEYGNFSIHYSITKYLY